MKNMVIALSLLLVFQSMTFAAGKAFDMEEYATLDELTTIIASRVHGAKVGGQQGTSQPKIRLAIIPVAPKRSSLAEEIGRRLAKTGKIDVLDADTTMAFIRERRLGNAAFVQELARAHNLDAVVAIRTYPSDGKTLVISRIFSGSDAKLLDTMVALVDAGPKGPFLGTPVPIIVPAKQTGENAPDLPVKARYAVAADLDGDGRQEYVFSDGERLFVCRLEPAGWKKVWAESVDSGSGGGKHLYLDAADVNNNGRPEIFVTIMRGRKVSSAVYEEQGGTFQRIAEVPGFLRVLTYPGRGLILIGQESQEETFFSGTPKQYTWANGQYVAGADFPLPKGVNVYGFAFADFGEAHPLLVALDDKDHLRVYSRDVLIWESPVRYGAVETVAIESSTDAYNLQLKVGVKGRIVAMDIDGDGRDEILIPKNIGTTVFGAAREAEFHALAWTGARLEQQLVMSSVPGAVLDFSVERRGNAGVQVLALVQTKGGVFTKPGARLITYWLQ